MGLLVGLVIAAIFSWRRISIFRGRIHPSSHLGCHSNRGEKPGLAGAIVERWNSPKIRPAVHLDVLPGDEARAGTAEEAHGGGDVGGFAAPARQRLHERMMLRHRL